MRRRKSGKATLITILIFVLAIVFATLVVRILPIPAAYEKLVFFLLIPGISFTGVYFSNRRSNR